jgi:hypothetical protein
LRKQVPLQLFAGVVAVTTTVMPVGADAKPIAAQALHRSVQQSLAFLERDGLTWIKERGCASCHHVPFLLWTHNEAKRRGFPVDAQKLEGWVNWTLVDMLARGDGGGLETLAQVLLGRDRSSPWREKPPRHNKTVDPFETLWGLLLEKQKPDGSFPSEGQRGFPEEISTSWALLALASRDSGKAPKDVTEGMKEYGFGPGLTSQLRKLDERKVAGENRALAWLKTGKTDESTEALLLRMLVAEKFSDAARSTAMRKELIARQNADGGWAYQSDHKKSDAFATGQALFALAAVGSEADNAVVDRGRRYLLETQQQDGSWLVASRSIHSDEASDAYLKRTDKVYSYWGTAWAILGLLHSAQIP